MIHNGNPVLCCMLVTKASINLEDYIIIWEDYLPLYLQVQHLLHPSEQDHFQCRQSFPRNNGIIPICHGCEDALQRRRILGNKTTSGQYRNLVKLKKGHVTVFPNDASAVNNNVLPRPLVTDGNPSCLPENLPLTPKDFNRHWSSLRVEIRREVIQSKLSTMQAEFLRSIV
jgi:hypothetical protein